MNKRVGKRGIAGAISAVLVVAVLVVPLWLMNFPGSSGEGSLSEGERVSWTSDARASAEEVQAKAEAFGAGVVGQSTVDERLVVQRDDDGIAPEHEAGAVLVQPPADASADELNVALAQLACVEQPSVTQKDVQVGWARVRLADGVGVRDAVAQLRESGVVAAAQPNFVYRLDDDLGMRADADSNSASSTDGFQAAQLDEETFDRVDGSDAGELADDSAFAAEDGAFAPQQTSYYAYGNDQLRNNQWMLGSVHCDRAYQYLIEELRIDEDADDRPAIAVLDTGCYLPHEDLKDNVTHWYNPFTDREDYTGFYDVDLEAHGTHVCSIASARINNGYGMQGAGGNSKLVPVVVFEYDDDGELSATSETLLKAYEYVMEHASSYHIKVVNMSLGANVDEDGLDDGDEAMFQVIGKAAREYNVLTVVSAGNSGARGAYTDFPSYLAESAIGCIAATITSTDWDIGRASFSNYNKPGMKVEELIAPGTSILGANDGWIKYHAFRSNCYIEYSGTSMAAPCVAGIAALVWSVQPDLTVDQVRSVLFSTAQDIVTKGEDDLQENRYAEGFDLMSGFGCPDALAAVKAADKYLVGGTSLGVGLTLALDPSSDAKAAATAKGWEWTWESSDPGVATVEGGTVSAVQPGATVITACAGTGEGAMRLSQIVTVHNPVISGADLVVKGTPEQYTMMQRSADGSLAYGNGEWVWSSSDENVATVSDSGEVRGLAPGTTTLTAVLATNPSVVATKDVDVRIKLTSLSLSTGSFMYNGRQQRPSVTVRCTEGIAPPTAYTLSWTSDTTNVGTKTVVATGRDGYIGTVQASYRITPDRQAMYRLYNPNSGEHFYTASTSERDNLARLGWRKEGEGWKAPLVGSDVYRLYNPNAGEHHYTLSAAERDTLVRLGWRYEGVGWKSGGRVPLYRQYNPNAFSCNHNYTTSLSEHNWLCSIGWRGEGVSWYGL